MEMSELSNLELLIIACVIFVLVVVYGISCLRWSYSMTKKCKSVHKWCEEQMEDNNKSE